MRIRGFALPVVLLVDASLQQSDAAGRNSRPTPVPAPEIVAAQLNKAPLCLPPTSCPGWIAPCLHSLTVAEALRLERTSRRWRAWLLSADHIWQQLAASSGVSLRCAGPLAAVLSGGELAARLCGISGRAE